MNRRKFLGSMVAASLAARAGAFAPLEDTDFNFVPSQPLTAPNYWCTWAVQNYQFGQGAALLNPTALEGDAGAELARAAMCESALFGVKGWATHFHRAARGDLYLLLDDGWESGGMASFLLDSAKFPSFRGSPTARLRSLNQRLQKLGWRGAALWCRNTPGGAADLELAQRAADAGVHYWKIDIGDPGFHLPQLRTHHQLPLTFEHVQGEMPVNGDWRADGRFGVQPWEAQRMRILRATDVYRTYDVTSILSVPTTLDRVSEMLHSSAGHPDATALLNVEDEVYIAAVLGCTMGIMRHPQFGLRPGDDPDLFFNGERRAKQRMDEVLRALRWQRIAPPFAAGAGSFNRSAELLTDAWRFSPGETWQHDLLGTTVRQSAPAVLARNLALPEVTGSEEKPFVFAARFPNGAVAIGAHERTQQGRAWQMPLCDVTLDLGDAPGPIGIFGSFRSLTLHARHLRAGRRIYAQDLAGNRATEITPLIHCAGDSMRLDGELLRDLGRRNATAGDLSSPGLVLGWMQGGA